MDITIAIATHKHYKMPEDPLYLPVQAGHAIHPALGYTADDSGEHISGKNERYCELTVLYWAWKNLSEDAIGLCHYRRYFALRRFGRKWDRILTGAQAAQLMKDTDVLLPKPRNYFIETNYSQYAHAHHAGDLEAVRCVIGQCCPEYAAAFDRVMARTWGHRFNMLVMRRDVLDRYCSWLFDILQRLETQLDTTDYSAYDQRVFGFLAERLLDVWLETERPRYRELPVVNMESQHWPRKIAAFLGRKLRGSGSAKRV